jgi:hypothetical protein
MEIWKFPLKLQPRTAVEMPEMAELLHVGIQATDQDETICLWASCHPDMPRDFRYFSVVATGERLPSGLKKYLGTVQMGRFVWHVFERKE